MPADAQAALRLYRVQYTMYPENISQAQVAVVDVCATNEEEARQYATEHLDKSGEGDPEWGYEIWTIRDRGPLRPGVYS